MKIKTETEFARIIDSYAEILARIDSLKKESKLQKTLLELYACETGTNSYRTKNTIFKMERGAPALRRREGVSEEAVVALLEKDDIMRGFVHVTYDGDAIKSHVAKLAEPEKALAAFDLYLTEPERHAKVKSR